MAIKKETIKQVLRYKEIKAWYEKYERVLLPATLVLGVILDWITFTNINITTSFLLLAIYLVVSGFFVVVLNAHDPSRLTPENRLFRYARLSAPLVIQFLFGALLSGVFIFYVFSGTVFVDWPFLLILVVLMVSNDVFRHYLLRPTVQVPVYFFITLSFFSVLLPFVFNSLSARLFLISGGISLIFIAGYVALLIKISPALRHKLIHFCTAIASIFFFVNIFYFLNIIPPIPLSLRDTELAHTLTRNGNSYTLLVEDQSWFHRLAFGKKFFRQGPDDKVYVYTAIFAPGSLTTKIVHHWQYYDENRKEWTDQGRFPFTISGGRKEGYRGYSVKTVVPAGKWRVYVETERGQVLGRVGFRVVNVFGQDVKMVEVGK